MLNIYIIHFASKKRSEAIRKLEPWDGSVWITRLNPQSSKSFLPLVHQACYNAELCISFSPGSIIFPLPTFCFPWFCLTCSPIASLNTFAEMISMWIHRYNTSGRELSQERKFHSAMQIQLLVTRRLYLCPLLQTDTEMSCLGV